jgi:hypothetical protein
MTQFHEGQEVEIWDGFGVLRGGQPGSAVWRQAKIIGVSRGLGDPALNPGDYAVQFPDGTRAVFDAKNMRLPSLNFDEAY